MPYKPTGQPPGRPRKQVVLPPLGEKPNLSQAQWEALKTEYQFADWARQAWPSSASLRRLAKAARVSHETVRNWRLDPVYLKGLIWSAAEELNHALREQPSPQPRWSRSQHQSDALLDVHLKNYWPGPTVSPLDGKTYDNPDDYFRHVTSDPNVVWVGDLPRASRKK